MLKHPSGPTRLRISLQRFEHLSRVSAIRNDRGAILVHTAIAFVGLLAFAALTVDYGVMWASRRQAQNSADAAALAGAISIGLTHPGDFNIARSIASAIGAENAIFGRRPTIIVGSGASCEPTDDISFPYNGCSTSQGALSFAYDNQCSVSGSCVRVNVYRNEYRDALPTFFANLFNRSTQGVKATATAEVSGGNHVECLLPFAIMDRWADNYDNPVDTTYFANDGLMGVAGWTPNDNLDLAQGDVYIPPYTGNTNTTGWTIQNDYGRQFIMKDGSPNAYSSGWFGQVDLPASTGSSDYKWNIENCNAATVGIADSTFPCTGRDEEHGCMSIKTGNATGPTRQGITTVVGYDSAAQWDWTVQGPQGKMGAVVGGKGMSTPRIRPLVILDANHYEAQGCSGTTCLGKVANIIGFFVEGMCKDVTMDPGMICDDPNKDVVGRIVTLPGDYASSGGGVVTSAEFVKVIRLIR